MPPLQTHSAPQSTVHHREKEIRHPIFLSLHLPDLKAPLSLLPASFSSAAILLLLSDQLLATALLCSVLAPSLGNLQ